jgi:hypothetical protein
MKNAKLLTSISLLVGGGILVMSWIILFTAGLTISSEAYRKALSVKPTINDFVAVLFLYTPTNIAFLALMSAGMGGFASKLAAISFRKMLTDEGVKNLQPGSLDFKRLAYLEESPLLSMARGLIAYIAFLGGSFIVVDSPFENPSPDQYSRLAATVSLLAVSIGYDPTRIQSFLDSVPIKTTQKGDKT